MSFFGQTIIIIIVFIMDYKKTAYVKFQGGIGNQLFQFSLAIYLRERFNLNVIANKYWYKDPLNRKDLLYKFIKKEYHFPEENNFKINLISKFLNRSEKLITFFIKRNRLITLNFNGYWQDIFFANFLKKNLNYFDPNIFIKQIEGDYYLFHLRRGDFITSKAHYTLNDEFYCNNYFFFKKKKIIILSENKNDGLSLKDKLNDKSIEVFSESEVDSFGLIFNAKGGISSNSSFCWWSIFLSQHRNWIMPYQWLRKETIFEKNLEIDKTLII